MNGKTSLRQQLFPKLQITYHGNIFLKQCKYNALGKYYAINQRHLHDTAHHELELYLNCFYMSV